MSGQLTKQMQKMEKRFDSLKKEFASDGKVTRDELVILKSVQTRLDAFRKKIAAHNKKNGIIDFGADEAEVISVEQKDYQDSVFKTAFNQSIRDWSQDGNIALNRVKTYFIKSDGPSGIAVGDLLNVVGLIMMSNPAAAAVIGTLKVSAALVTSAYKATLPATPSLNDIHSSWATALGKYGSASHDKEYQQFVKDWKKANKVPAENQKVPVNTFLPACAEYAKKALPRSKDVEKQFLAKVLSNVEDSWDTNKGGGLDKAGVCEVYMVYLASSFGGAKGQLDDVSEQLLEAVRTVWKNKTVIDLPLQLHFTMENSNGADLAEIQRTSKKPGSTAFKLRSGDKGIFDEFMKQKAWTKMKCSKLKYDGI